MPIADVDELKAHLQTAIELEHATIPPYLCALYSIPDGKNVSASALIRSVVMEEMLHMVLAANLLNAIGGKPDLTHGAFVPSYPGYLPHSDKKFVVGLLPFGTDAIDTFLKIEKPALAGAPPQGGDYATIAQFYLGKWDEDAKYVSSAKTKLQLSNKAFERYREAQCAVSASLGGGAIGHASDMRRLACLTELNDRRAEQLRAAFSDLPMR